MREFALAAIGIVALVSPGTAFGQSEGAATVAVALLLSLPFLVFGVWLAVWVAGVPGRVARSRGHKDAEAIRICGFVGLVLPVAWIVAIVWAHTASSITKSAEAPKPMLGNPCQQYGATCPTTARFCGGCGVALAVETSWRSFK